MECILLILILVCSFSCFFFANVLGASVEESFRTTIIIFCENLYNFFEQPIFVDYAFFWIIFFLILSFIFSILFYKIIEDKERDRDL